jgi:hypothetical protein
MPDHPLIFAPAKLPPQLVIHADLAQALFVAAAASARVAARAGHQLTATPKSSRATLRPGPSTPVWNELVKQARALLRVRGEKARLARVLGVPRQRVNDFLQARTACPDAERTLLLLCWVACRHQGGNLAA